MRAPRIGAAVPADQLVLELPGLPPPQKLAALPRRTRQPALAVPDEPVPVAGSAVGERVWLIWEDDEVLGIYADPEVAAAECAGLRRHAHRERLQVRYEWMAVPVFTGRRHQPSTAEAPRGSPADAGDLVTGSADTGMGPGGHPQVPVWVNRPPPAVRPLTAEQRSDLSLLLADARRTHSWTALAERIHGHVRAGVRLEDIADAAGLGVPRVREIRLRHSGYDPAADRGVARQVGEWGSVQTAAAAAGTTASTLGQYVTEGTAAGVTGLCGQRRLWHAPATAAWWAEVAAAAAVVAAEVAAARTDRSASIRRLHATGVPVAAIAAELGVSVTTVRRTLR